MNHIDNEEDVIDFGDSTLLIAQSKEYPSFEKMAEDMEKIINHINSRFRFKKVNKKVRVGLFKKVDEVHYVYDKNESITIEYDVHKDNSFSIFIMKRDYVHEKNDTILNEATIKYTDYNLSVNGKKYKKGVYLK